MLVKDWMDMGCSEAPAILQAINSYGEWRKLYTKAVDNFMLIWDYILTKYNLQTRAITAVIRDVVTKMQHLHTKLPPAYEFMMLDLNAPPNLRVADLRVKMVNRYFMTRQITFPAVMEALSLSLEKIYQHLQHLWVAKGIYQKDALVPRREKWGYIRTQETYWNDFCESMRNLRAGPKAPENGAAGGDVGNLTAKLAALKACV